jgi:hypothetical protein
MSRSPFVHLLVATTLAAVGLTGVAASGGAASAAPVATTCSGVIEIHKSTDQSLLGYVRATLTGFGAYEITGSKASAATVTATPAYGGGVDLVVDGAPAGTPNLGAAVGYKEDGDGLGPDSQNYNYLAQTSTTAAGATPQTGTHSDTADPTAKIESAIWSLPPSLVLSGQWTNSDGSEPANVFALSGGTLTLTGDLDTFIATYEEGSQGVTLVLAPTTGADICGKQPQALDFTSTPQAHHAVGTTYAVSATGGGSGNPVTFTSSTPSVCTVAGSTVSFAAAGTCTVAADQLGNDTYSAAAEATQDITVVLDPTIIAKLASKKGPSAAGWYRTPVVITFTCTVGSSALTSACPTPVTLKQSGAAQAVAGSIAATDGGAAAVSVAVSIDRVAPKARIVTGRHIRCVASDALSGLQGRCRLTHRAVSHHRVRYTATATDRAGNKTRVVRTIR